MNPSDRSRRESVYEHAITASLRAQRISVTPERIVALDFAVRQLSKRGWTPQSALLAEMLVEARGDVR